MILVTDTHSIIWYFTEDSRLSQKALEAFEETIKEGIIIVPAVVLAEIMYIAEKGKTSLTFGETLQKIEESDNFSIAPLDIEILKVAAKIGVVLEMHDRLIIATALYHDVSLVTKDDQIRTAGICSTLW